MTPDRDTLARDLLTLPALVGAPGEVVRGLVLRAPGDAVFPQAVDFVDPFGHWIMPRADGHPAALHAAGWRVDLDAPATAGVLLGLLPKPVCVVQCDHPGCPGEWTVTCPGADEEGTTLAEAAARALVEVGRGR